MVALSDCLARCAYSLAPMFQKAVGTGSPQREGGRLGLLQIVEIFQAVISLKDALPKHSGGESVFSFEKDLVAQPGVGNVLQLCQLLQ
eukprot:13626823-Alexandrium_andersonii.AAC.1